jgi:hypothetical protein
MNEPVTIARKRRRPAAVTLAAWYFILQGVAGLGVSGVAPGWRFALVILFVCIGIGLLRLYRAAWYAAAALGGVIVVWCTYHVLTASNPDALPTPLAGVFVGSLILVVFLLPALRLPFFTSEDTRRETAFKDWLPWLGGTLLALTVSVASALFVFRVDRGNPRGGGAELPSDAKAAGSAVVKGLESMDANARVEIQALVAKATALLPDSEADFVRNIQAKVQLSGRDAPTDSEIMRLSRLSAKAISLLPARDRCRWDTLMQQLIPGNAEKAGGK